jgi:hypothetical protein
VFRPEYQIGPLTDFPGPLPMAVVIVAPPKAFSVLESNF